MSTNIHGEFSYIFDFHSYILNEHQEESKTIMRRLEKLGKKEINARFMIVGHDLEHALFTN